MSQSKRITIHAPAAPAENQWLRRGIPLAVAVLTFIVFLPALKNGFVNWDDFLNFVDNPYYRGLGWKQLKWMFTTAGLGTYAPLTFVTFGLDYVLWGMNPSGYHLTSVVLHSMSALVFYFLFLRLAESALAPTGPVKRAESYLAAGFAALFFSIHPFRVEPVVWLSARIDILASLFYMLAIHWYIRPESSIGPAPSFRRKYMLSLVFLVLALLSKGMAVSLPVVLVILDIYPLRRLPFNPGRWFLRENHQIWLEKIPFFTIAFVFGAAGYLAQVNADKVVSLQASGVGPRIAQILFGYGFYVWKTIVPVNLAPLYKLTGGLGNPQVWAGGATLLAASAAAVSMNRSRPVITAAWVYYLATLGPVSGILKTGSQAAADRYSYLPCMGFAVLAGCALWSGLRYSSHIIKRASAMLACLILLILGRLTWGQAQVWRDSVSLWRHTISVQPDAERGYNNLGTALAAQGKSEEEALNCYRAALKVNPDYITTLNNLGAALAGQGQIDAAIDNYMHALRLNQDHAPTHQNLAVALATQGDSEGALRQYKEVLRITPGSANAALNAGVILDRQGKLEEAINYYREAVRLDRKSAKARNNLGSALARQGKDEEAAVFFKEALSLNPALENAGKNLLLLQNKRNK